MKFVVYGAFEMFSVFSLYFAIYFRPPINQSMLNMDWEGQIVHGTGQFPHPWDMLSVEA